MFFSATTDACSSLYAAPWRGGVSFFGTRASRVYHVEGNVAVGKAECARLVAETIRAKGVRVAVVEENAPDTVLPSSPSSSPPSSPTSAPLPSSSAPASSQPSSPSSFSFVRTNDEACSCAGAGAGGSVFRGGVAGREKTTKVSLDVLNDCLRRHQCALKALRDGFDIVLVVRHPTTALKVFDHSESVASLFERIGASVPDFLSTPENTIYVKNSARACRERATRRGRESERHLTEDAFEVWHERHEDMMREREASGGKVYTFDTFGADSSQVVTAIVGCLGFKA